MGWFSDGQSLWQLRHRSVATEVFSITDHLRMPDSNQAQSMQQFKQDDNKPELTHELIAGAAAYYAADKYEEHCEANGKNTYAAPSPKFNRQCATGSSVDIRDPCHPIWRADKSLKQVNPHPTMKPRKYSLVSPELSLIVRSSQGLRMPSTVRGSREMPRSRPSPCLTSNTASRAATNTSQFIPAR
jgi:hypothetical protein